MLDIFVPYIRNVKTAFITNHYDRVVTIKAVANRFAQVFQLSIHMQCAGSHQTQSLSDSILYNSYDIHVRCES